MTDDTGTGDTPAFGQGPEPPPGPSVRVAVIPVAGGASRTWPEEPQAFVGETILWDSAQTLAWVDEFDDPQAVDWGRHEAGQDSPAWAKARTAGRYHYRITPSERGGPPDGDTSEGKKGSLAIFIVVDPRQLTQQDEAARLEHEFRLATSGSPWHGDSVSDILRGLSHETAAKRPIGQAHSIWEILVHMTGWAREVSVCLRGAPTGIPADGDWPKIERFTVEAWAATLADFRSARDQLAATLKELDSKDLGRQPEKAAGSPFSRVPSYHEMIVGIMQHEAYHSGQIALLKKALT